MSDGVFKFSLFVIGIVFTGIVMTWLAFRGNPQLPTAQAAPTPYISHGKCDSPDTIATVKDLALRKLNARGGEYLLQTPNWFIDKTTWRYPPENMSIGSFIVRASNCSATITLKNVRDPRYYDHGDVTAEISVDYTIEHTTDGKTMVSARFRPNY